MFKDPLVVEKLRDGKNWRLARGFRYTTLSGDHIDVPTGFVTDFASIPRGLWNLFPPTGLYGHAAVVHDFLYRTTKKCRKDCDQIFLDAMGELEVNVVTRYVIYYAVRLMGGCARK